MDNGAGGPLAVGGDDGSRWTRTVRRLSVNVCRLKAVGITRIAFTDAFKTVLLPVLTFWGIAVSLPYVISRGILPRIPLIPVSYMHAAFTYGWFFESNFVVVYLLCSELGLLFRRYQAKIRDQHYLLHRELINMAAES